MRRPVNHEFPITAPAKMKSEDSSLLVAKTFFTQNQSWKVFMRSPAITVFQDELSDRGAGPLFLKLTVPSADQS